LIRISKNHNGLKVQNCFIFCYFSFTDFFSYCFTDCLGEDVALWDLLQDQKYWKTYDTPCYGKVKKIDSTKKKKKFRQQKVICLVFLFLLAQLSIGLKRALSVVRPDTQVRYRFIHHMKDILDVSFISFVNILKCFFSFC
jgi:hypothetical protein